MVEEQFAKLLAAGRQGVLVTLRASGRPQLANVNYAWYPDEDLIRISTVADRAKVKNLRRDPRASFHVTSPSFWDYAVVDGTAAFSPVAAGPDDETVTELVRVYRDVRGEHPDWDDFRAAMVRERRLVLRIQPDRVYGLIQS